MLQGWYPREARKVRRTFVGSKSGENGWKMAVEERWSTVGVFANRLVSRAAGLSSVSESDERKGNHLSLWNCGSQHELG